MDGQNVLMIFAGFISILLTVNAYFTRETLLRIVKLEVRLENNSTKQFYNEREIAVNGQRIGENAREIRELRDFKHKHINDAVQIAKIIEQFEHDLNQIIKEGKK